MRIRLPQSKPARIKFVVTAILISVAINLGMELLAIATLRLGQQFLMNHLSFTYAEIIASMALSVAAEVLFFLAVMIATRISILKSKQQRAALWVLIVFSGIVLVHHTTAGLTYFDSILEFETNWWPGLVPDFVRNVFLFLPLQIILSYVPLAAAIAGILIFVPPSFDLLNWSPKRERVARYLAIIFCSLFILGYIINIIYWINPFGFTDAPHSRLKTFLSHVQFAMSWLHPLSFLAALIFLIHLRRNAHQLTYDPNACTNCDYPLDKPMATCPECGVTRTLIPETSHPAPLHPS
jgi:hypothetical protein